MNQLPDRESRRNPAPHAQPETTDAQETDTQETGTQETPGTADGPGTADTPETADISAAEADHERQRRRALFLSELAEARALRERVQPRRARAARLRHVLLMRTFRW